MLDGQSAARTSVSMGDRPARWHTEQVRTWLTEHAEARRWVFGRPDRTHFAPALQLVAQAAIEQLPGVDFGLVDWEAAVEGLEAELYAAASEPARSAGLHLLSPRQRLR